MSAKLYERCKLIPLCPEATSVADSYDLDSFKLSEGQRACILIQHSASVTGNNILTMGVGASTGAKTTTVTFRYRLGSAVPKVATADVLGTEATSAALTLTAATYQGLMLVLEITAAEVLAAGLAYTAAPFDGKWVTVNFDGAASVGTVMAFAILSESRYLQATQATAIT